MSIRYFFRFVAVAAVFSAATLPLCAQDKFSFVQQPYLQNLGETEVTILWETNSPSLGWVEIAPDDGSHIYACARQRFYDSEFGTRRIGKLHKVTLTGLKPATTYKYRIVSKEVVDTTAGNATFYTGHVATSYKKPLSFKTLGDEPSEFQFTVMNDIHQDSARFSTLAEAGNVDKAAFVVFNGDMVSSMNTDTTITKCFLNYTSSFSGEKPFYIGRGNHETRGQYACTFMDYFPSPTGMPYYAFEYGDAFFIMLDSGEDKPDGDVEYYDRAEFSKYRGQEAEWLKTVVESPEFKNAKYRIVFVHMPPVAEKSSWYGCLEGNRLFVPILNNVGIDLMLCGHTHKYGYHPASGDANVFPIIVNGNKTVAVVSVKEESLNVEILDLEGKKVKIHTFKR